MIPANCCSPGGH